MNTRLMSMTSIAAVVASLAVAGCNRQDRPVANGSNADTSVAQVDRSNSPADSKSSMTMDRAKDSTREMAQETKEATRDATDKIGDKVTDAVITTSVKTEIAKDPDLSAIKINVDTDSGHVALRGTAPSADARDHATSLAAAVKGVVSVDNQLSVTPGK